MIKRIFDILCSIFGLIVFSPILLISSILIKYDSPGSIFFKQTRIGKNQKEFNILKFRTMRPSTSTNDLKITTSNDNRITKIGAFLRKYKIDELPQLFNVLIGSMSIVGPRPEVADYVKFYTKQDKDIIFSVKPGITDLASIEFRNENEILSKEKDPRQAYITKILPQKLKYCRFYVEKQSLFYDMIIIFKTIKAIVI